MKSLDLRCVRLDVEVHCKTSGFGVEKLRVCEGEGLRVCSNRLQEKHVRMGTSP
jgi:hypothetical protein